MTKPTRPVLWPGDRSVRVVCLNSLASPPDANEPGAPFAYRAGPPGELGVIRLSYGGRENRRSLIRQKMVQLCRRTGERRPWPPTERMTFKPSRASSTSSSNRADPFPRSSRLSPAGNTRTPPRKRGKRPGPRSVGVLRISTPGAFDRSRNSTANFGRSTGWPPEHDLPRSADCPGRGGHRPHIQLDLRAESRRGQALVRSILGFGRAAQVKTTILRNCPESDDFPEEVRQLHSDPQATVLWPHPRATGPTPPAEKNA